MPSSYFLDWKYGSDEYDGSSLRPWKTISKANASIRGGTSALDRGDTVFVRGNENADTRYFDAPVVTTPWTTWKAAAGHNPAVDGRYSWDLRYLVNGVEWLPGPNEGNSALSAKWKATLPGKGTFSNLVEISGTGVVWEGIDVFNSSGDGMTVSASHVTIRDIAVDFCYSACMMIDSNDPGNKLDGVLVEESTFSRSSMKFFNRNRGAEGESGGPALVTGCFKVLNSMNTVIRNCVVYKTRGEGFAAAKGSYKTLFESCTAWDTEHVSFYITKGAEECTMVRCKSIQTIDPMATNEQRKPGDNFSFGMETANDSGYSHGSAHHIYNCVGIGGYNLFWLRNNKDSYNSTADGLIVEHCTFIAGPQTNICIRINDNVHPDGDPHTANNSFRNNIILSKWHDSATIATKATQFSKSVIGHNIWSSPPHETMRGANDVYGPASGQAAIETFCKTIVANPFDGYTSPQGEWGVPPADVESIFGGAKLIADAVAAIGKASARSYPNGLSIKVPDDIGIDAWGQIRTDAPGGFYDIGGYEFPVAEPPPPPPPPPADPVLAVLAVLGIEKGDEVYLWDGKIAADGRRAAVWYDNSTGNYVAAFLYAEGVTHVTGTLPVDNGDES